MRENFMKTKRIGFPRWNAADCQCQAGSLFILKIEISFYKTEIYKAVSERSFISNANKGSKKATDR